MRTRTDIKEQKAVVSGCVSPATRLALLKYAEAERRTLSSVVAEAVEDFVKKILRKAA